MTNDPFKIRDHVPAFDELVREIRQLSASTRAALRCRLDVRFGPGPDDLLDLFFPDESAGLRPVHLFIHGGYWRMFGKADYSYVADTITQAGAIAVVVDYTLMPRVRMADLIDQVRRARDWIVAHAADFGGDASRLTISGHSAGAHLATFLCNEGDANAPKRALLLGGLYELKPLQSSFLQAEIMLTDDEVTSFSPLDHRFNHQTSVMLLAGEEETPPFHQQMRRYASHLTNQGVAPDVRVLAGADHMSSVRDLGLPSSQTGSLLADMIKASLEPS